MTDAVPTRGQLSRFERFATVGSTNDIVRAWLADATPEVCLAVADEQAEGRGRHGRTWTAPPGAALLLSLGFRPTWMAPDRAWRLAGTAALAMCDAAEETAGLPVGAVRMKWPNDLVVETGEHQSATLMSMALHSLGVPAISLTGPQAGITTDGRYGKARIAGIDPRRVRAELAAGKVVIVAGFQGMSAKRPRRPGGHARRPATSTPPRSPPSAAAARTPRPSPSRPSSRRIAARSSRTSRASTPRTRGSPRTRASSPSSATRR